MVTLLERAAGAARAAAGRPQRPARPARRVLVADPHADTAESTALLLRLWGLDVRTAASGPDALRAAVDGRPDAVVMELELPGLGGCEVARLLRGPGGVPDALLVAVTGYGDERHRALARDAGFDRHLVKPACPDELRELLVLGRPAAWC